MRSHEGIALVQLPVGLHQRVKVLAVELGLSMKALVSDAVESHVAPLEAAVLVDRADVEKRRVEKEEADKEEAAAQVVEQQRQTEELVVKHGFDKFKGKTFRHGGKSEGSEGGGLEK